jgi:hypothetical protein
VGGIGRTLLVVTVFVLVAWAILESIGFEMALLWSLGLSVVLTLILNGALAIARRRRRPSRHNPSNPATVEDGDQLHSSSSWRTIAPIKTSDGSRPAMRSATSARPSS